MKYVLTCLMVVGFSGLAQAQIQAQPSVSPTTPTASSANLQKASNPRRSAVKRPKFKVKLDPSKICPAQIKCTIGNSPNRLLHRKMQKADARGKYTCVYELNRTGVVVDQGAKCSKVPVTDCTKLLLASQTKSKVFPDSGTRGAMAIGGTCRLAARVWFKQK